MIRMISRLLLSVVCFQFAPPIYAGSLPKNAHVNVFNQVECNKGFKFRGSECVALNVPKNAHVNVFNQVECNKGFKFRGSECVALNVPKNAHVNVFNQVECDKGFKFRGSECVALNVPKNAHVNVFNQVECDKGFKFRGSECIALNVPKNAHVNVFNQVQCNTSYKWSGKVCEKFIIPENAELAPGGNDWMCSTRFTDNGLGGCREMTQSEWEHYQLLLMLARACGSSYSYDVSGYDDNGNYVYGTVDACSDSKSVSGELYTEDGEYISIDGEWDGYGEVEAYGNRSYFYLETD